MHHRTIDQARLPKALAQAAIEELRPKVMPREFAAVYCKDCGTDVQSTLGPASEAAKRTEQFYTNLADGAKILSALREACKIIEDSARDAFFRAGMSDHEFERAWRSEELQRWGHWTRLKTVAGLPHTQPELVGGIDG